MSERARLFPLLAMLALSGPAAADEATLLASHQAYEEALAENRYDDADAAGENAWREAETTWGGSEDTGILAFNLARLRLMRDRRSSAIEPSLRLAELVESGAVQSVAREEAAAFLALAQFPDHASDSEVMRLESALVAYDPPGSAEKQVAALGWTYAAMTHIDRRRWRPATEAAGRALALMNPSTQLELRTRVALLGAQAAYEVGDLPSAITAAQRGVAGFPPQPRGGSLDPTLGRLLQMEFALVVAHAAQHREEFEQTIPELVDPAWDDGRYSDLETCPIEWIDQEQPRFRPPEVMDRAGAPPASLLLEYYLTTDGLVERIELVGESVDESYERQMRDAMRTWRAEPPRAAECFGPFLFKASFRVILRFSN